MRRRGILSWAELRSIGNSRLVQASILFPLVGYLILFNDEVGSFFRTGKLDAAAPSLELIGWLWARKLYFLYFGLMSLGIGSAVYSIWCPHIVKKHADFADYIRLDGAALSSEAVMELSRLISFYPSDKQDILRAWYAYLSDSSPWARNASTVLFGAGFLLLAVPSAISAIKIVALLLHQVGPPQ